MGGGDSTNQYTNKEGYPNNKSYDKKFLSKRIILSFATLTISIFLFSFYLNNYLNVSKTDEQKSDESSNSFLQTIFRNLLGNSKDSGGGGNDNSDNSGGGGGGGNGGGDDPPPPPAKLCNDGKDNDNDGWVDLKDLGCMDSDGNYNPDDDDEFNDPTEFECSNGLDDEITKDGLIDGNDPFCKKWDSPSETAQCQDGLDNDNDFRCDTLTGVCTDGSIPGDLECDGPNDESEGKIEICNNEIDDDGDNRIDCQDSDCDKKQGNGGTCEHGTELTCNDGFNNDADINRDCKDPDCFDDPACDTGGNEICDDEKDNDNNGKTDCQDNACIGKTGPGGGTCQIPESSCSDFYDNDGDGVLDCSDSDCAENPSCEDYQTANMIVYATYIDDYNSEGWVEDSSGNYIYGTPSNPANHPLVWAIENAGDQKGRIIDFYGSHSPIVFDDDSTYSHVINSMDSSKDNPIVIQGRNGAHLIGRSWGDTIEIPLGQPDNHQLNYIIWKSITIFTSWRSGVHIGGDTSKPITGWEFHNILMDGGWDFKNNKRGDPRGKSGKWGFQIYNIGDFVIKDSIIRNIEEEHGLYVHNPSGPMTLQGNEVYQVGRTAYQMTARKQINNQYNLPANPYPVNIIDNTIADTGLSEGDFYGGQSITIVGRNTGLITITGNEISYCIDKFTPGLCESVQQRINDFFNPGRHYGAGATVTWTTDKEDYENSGHLIYANNHIIYGSNSFGYAGQNMAISINAMETAEVYNNIIDTGFNKIALILGRDDIAHPTPLNYCITNNQINNGGKIYVGGKNQEDIVQQPVQHGTANCPPHN